MFESTCRSNAVTTALLISCLAGCSSDDITTPPADDPPERIYVTPGGTGDGSADNPFGDIEEAVEGSSPGDTLTLASGDYVLDGDLILEWPLSIIGSGIDQTRVDGNILVAAGDSSAAVRVRGLSCDFIGFTGGCPNHPSKLFADSCAVDEITVSEPPSHVVVFTDCDIEGGLEFSHGDGEGRHVFERCNMGYATYSHGHGIYHNVLTECEIENGIFMSHGGGGSVRIVGNTIGGGLSDSGGDMTTLIRGNHILSGGITDSSGGLGDSDNPVEDCIIENNVFDNGTIVSSGNSITIRGNTITTLEATTVILLTAGAPTRIIDNVITLPPADLPPGFDWMQPELSDYAAGIHTASGSGEIIGNTVTGGAIGLYDNSGAVLVADNVLTNHETGVWTRGGGAYRNNTITDSRGDGMICGATGPHTGNTIIGCGGVGLRIFGESDLGGGPDSGFGGNILRDNAGYDLVIEIPADQDTIFALHNFWDHVTVDDVDNIDVWDGKDDPTKTIVMLDPLGMSRAPRIVFH